MLAIEVELLAGRYTATRFNDRSRSEWPPHPARLFSALVARWADEDPPEEGEQAALEWLETLGPPEVSCSDAERRAVVTHYVPGNDVSLVRSSDALYAKLDEAERALQTALVAADGPAARELAKLTGQLGKLRERALSDSARMGTAGGDSAAARSAARALLPEGRGKQGRTYPTMIPAEDRFWFCWPRADAHASPVAHLDRLLARVTRLGHSSSAVACRVSVDPQSASWVPDETGPESLRVPVPGQLSQLVAEFARHGGNEPRTLPYGVARYRRVAGPEVVPEEPPLLGGEWFVLARRSGAVVPATSALALAEAVRSALLSAAGSPSPELLSGHAPGAAGHATPASERPHLAVVPLPFVGHEHADGSVLGVALVLPTDASRVDRDTLLHTLAGWRNADKQFEVRLGRRGLLHLELAGEDEARRTLMHRTWCRPASRWVSVTPVALDRWPGDLRHRDPRKRGDAEEEAVQTVLQACRYAGLPEPVTVELELGSPLRGVAPLRSYAPYRRAGGSLARATVHVRLGFERPVPGPVLIGAGRYLGYGLCRPVRPEEDDDAR